MPSQARAVVESYFAAIARRDLDAARALLNDDLEFRGAFSRYTRADDYMETWSRLQPIIDKLEPLKYFESGDSDVCLIYRLFTDKTPDREEDIVEWFHVTDGKIDRLQVIFDARPFAALREREHADASASTDDA